MDKRKFAVLGGDLRSIKLAEFFASDGNEVKVFGFSKGNLDLGKMQCSNAKEAIEGADVVLGPVPCSNDEETLNAPLSAGAIYINDVFKLMSKNQLFIAGRISNKILQLSHVYNVYSIDFLEREELAVLNAIPTAEGAIQIAMEKMPITLHGSKTLVLGFGRVGKTLAKMLHGIGSHVYAGVRKYSDAAWIKSYGYNPVLLDSLKDVLGQMDVIFNTIPSLILDRDHLEKVSRDCLIIDLASKPGGVDFAYAEKLGLNVVWALSLPGKVAPTTAAFFIKETVYNILKELGV